MYSIRFSQTASHELERINRVDKKLYGRLITVIESLKENPWQGKQLKGRFLGDYSLRVGDYRVIYTIVKNCLTVFIIDMGHRKEVYR